jgi:hypothetical protein
MEATLNRSLGIALTVFALASAGVADGLRAQTQTMEHVLNQLFVFSGGNDPLFLAGSSADPL